MIPITTLMRLFPNDDEARAKARRVRGLLTGKLDPCEESPACAAWVRYGMPDAHEMVMCAVDDILATHGVEACFSERSFMEPFISYCNAGDPYALTLVYKHRTGRYVVASWGDIVEAAEAHGVVFQ